MDRFSLLKFVMEDNLELCKKELLENANPNIRQKGVTVVGEMSLRIYLAVEGIGLQIFAHDSMNEEKRLKQDIQDKVQVRKENYFIFYGFYFYRINFFIIE